MAAIFASLTGKIGYIVNMCRMKGGACFAKYTFAHMKMCAWLSRGKCLICGIFFRFCCVFVKRMIEFVKKLYFFVFLFIKKLTKHKGGGYTLFNRNNDGILCLCGFIVSFVPCAEERRGDLLWKGERKRTFFRRMRDARFNFRKEEFL